MSFLRSRWMRRIFTLIMLGFGAVAVARSFRTPGPRVPPAPERPR